MFLLQSNLPSQASTIIFIFIGIASFIIILGLSFFIFFVCKNGKRMKKNRQNIEKILEKLAAETDEEKNKGN